MLLFYVNQYSNSHKEQTTTNKEATKMINKSKFETFDVTKLIKSEDVKSINEIENFKFQAHNRLAIVQKHNIND